MTTTRVFKSGNSQAVRLPKEFSVSSKVLEIFGVGMKSCFVNHPRDWPGPLNCWPTFPMIFLLKDVWTRRHSNAMDCNVFSLLVGHKHLHLHSSPKTR